MIITLTDLLNLSKSRYHRS